MTTTMPFASPQNIKTTSLNWTSRVDYNSGVKITSNLSIPKSYQFTFKDDTDFINIDYKKKYGEPYGTFKFNVAFGITDTKKVELIFSATPIRSIVVQIDCTLLYIQLKAIIR